MTTVILPWPPAVNNLFMNVGKRRIRTRRYDAWIAEAHVAVLQQRPKAIRGKFHVSILCEPPDKRRRDLDGLAKAPLDLLVKAGVIEDDSLARSLGLFWSETTAKPGFVRVELTPAEPLSVARAA